MSRSKQTTHLQTGLRLLAALLLVILPATLSAEEEPDSGSEDSDGEVRIFAHAGAGLYEYNHTFHVPISYIDPRTGQLVHNAPGSVFTDVGDVPLIMEGENGDTERFDAGLEWSGLSLYTGYSRHRVGSAPEPQLVPTYYNTGYYSGWKQYLGFSYRFNRDGLFSPNFRAGIAEARNHYEFRDVLNYNTATGAYDYNLRTTARDVAAEDQQMFGVDLNIHSIGLSFGPFFRYQRIRYSINATGPTGQPVSNLEGVPAPIPSPAALADAMTLMAAPTTLNTVSVSTILFYNLAGVQFSFSPVRWLRFNGETARNVSHGKWQSQISATFLFHENVGVHLRYQDLDSPQLGRYQTATIGPVFTMVF